MRENKSAAVRVRLFPRVEYKKVGQLSQIHPHQTNGLDVMKFCASAKLLKTELDSTIVEETKF
jgi:hypothetical protein